MHIYDLNAFVSRSQSSDVIDNFMSLVGALAPLNIESGPWMAGGAVRRLISADTRDSDIDLFFSSLDQLLEKRRILLSAGATVVSQNPDVTTINVRIGSRDRTVQLIGITFYESANAVLDSFDFTICQCLTDGNKLLVGDYTLWDIGRKKLAINNVTYGISTMRRLTKYMRQGFTACSGTFADILDAVVVDPNIIHRETEYVD